MGIYILSNTYASFKVQFRKMLSNIEAEFKKVPLVKNTCNLQCIEY